MVALMLLLGSVEASSSSRFVTNTKLPLPIQNIASFRGGAKRRNQVPSEPAVTEGPFQTFVNTVKASKNHLAAAAAARSVSIFGMFPVGE